MNFPLWRALMVGAVVALMNVYPGRSQVSEGASRYSMAEIPGTEVRPIVSKAVEGMEYKIIVGLPDEYAASSDSYPVLYVLDAWNQYGIVIQAYRLLRVFREISPLIVVGISYDGDESAHRYNRSRDYLPTHIPTRTADELYGEGFSSLVPTSGGAANFLGFLRDELIPFIEREYRVDTTSRGIFGHSAGGLFTAWVLFTNPGIFQNYLLGSPALWWDHDFVLRAEEEFRKSHTSLKAKVFATVGSEEGEWLITSWARLRDRLQYRRYEGLDFTSMLFEGETHASVIPATFSRALRVLYGH